MSRAWQPGDVVAITYYGGAARIALVRGRRSGSSVLEFAYADGGWDEVADPHVSKTARPLVVIDPEDREQVDELCKALVVAMHRAGDVASAANGVHPATVVAALREFADPKPPRPPTPTGLGAVVVDTEAEAWVHFGNDCWIKQVPNANLHTKSYADIDFLELASDGAEPLANWERDLLRGQS